MQTFLFVLIIVAALGALVSIVRGVYYFLRTQHDQLGDGATSRDMALKQNKMMWRRIQFQALAIVFVVLLMLVARGQAA